MSNSNTQSLSINLSSDVFTECKNIAEKNGVEVETIIEEFVQFALALYREGKQQQRSGNNSVFTELHDSELVN